MAITMKTMILANNVYKTVGTARFAETLCGKKTSPIPIESVESTIHDPIMSHSAIE